MSNHFANGSCYLFLCCIALTTPPATTINQQLVSQDSCVLCIVCIVVGAVVLFIIIITVITGGMLLRNGKENKVVPVPEPELGSGRQSPGRRQEDEVLSEEQ